MFDEVEVETQYSHDISILCEKEKVILKTSTIVSEASANFLNKAYCRIDADNPKPYCEIKQEFDVKEPGKNKFNLVNGIILYHFIITAQI